MAVAQRKTRAKKVEDGIKPKVTEKVYADSYGYSAFKLTDSQKELANKIIANDLVVCSSPAGTGKSLAVLHTFVKMYLTDKTKQIVVVRTPVESGMDKIGFLPNSLSDKLIEHFSSTRYLLDKLLNKGKVDTDMEQRIHFKIPNYVLGSTFDNTLLLIDESQEIPPLIMKLILERVGVNSKVVVLGDPSQRYATEKGRNGLNDVMSRFFDMSNDNEPKFDGVAFHKFEIEDVQRSEFVKMVLRAYSV